jgi:hypothetical protein
VNRKSSSTFGVLVIAFLFLFSPAYNDYQQLIEADFLSSGEKYKDRDVEDFALDKQLNSIIDSGLFSFMSLVENNLFASITGPSLQIASSESKPFTLRC